MSIWNKVLLWLIGLSSLGLLIMAARAFQAHAYWMDTAQKLEKSIDRVKDENRLLLVGDKENLGINKERVLLHKLLVDRPRVWMNCVAQVPKGAATINVAIDMPGPHGIIANNTIYAFEAAFRRRTGPILGRIQRHRRRGETIDARAGLSAYSVRFEESGVDETALDLVRRLAAG